MSQPSSSSGFRQYVRDVSPAYVALALLLPLAAGLFALAWQQPAAPNLVHVVAGAARAGATLYLAGVLAPTLADLDDLVRAQVTIPLLPRHVLLFSSLAAVTLVTGAALAGATDRDHTAPVMLAAYLVGPAMLVVVASLIRLQSQIYAEVHGGETDMERVGALAARLGRASVVGAGLQVIILVVMALLRVA